MNKSVYDDPIMKKFGDYAREAVFGMLWSRPGLDMKTQALICVISDTAQARWPELAIHLRMARNQGWTEDELSEALMHLCGYIGLPSVREALLTAKEVFPRDARTRNSMRPRSGAHEDEVMTMLLMTTSDLPLKRIARGKVRDVYEVEGDRLLLVATDRVSAYDVVMAEPIPMKGAVLTQVSAWWFRQLGDAVQHHMISADADEIVAAVPALKPPSRRASPAAPCCAGAARCFRSNA